MAHYGKAEWKPKVVMTLHLPVDVAEKLRETADRLHLSYSKANRLAIEEWLGRQAETGE